MIERVCVYGASSSQLDGKYIAAVEQLGAALAERGLGLVFGGGAQGLMGAAARGAHSKGGFILGVAPDFFDVDGVLFQECSEFIYTKTMRERKQIMEDSADAFIVTPGGFGTFEEFFEILTLKQLERHNKPIAILNVDGYYDGLLNFVDACMEKNVIKEACKRLYKVSDNVEEILDYIVNYNEEQLSVKNLRHVEEDLTYDATAY
ncbi:MAG: TIGR00730 family Rossman fold protein [Christensenellaceae bacterium]|nr:TIGR00730 family Rossman fold protein [Christensenellaceae bacterium]